jgi:hypothetical protein
VFTSPLHRNISSIVACLFISADLFTEPLRSNELFPLSRVMSQYVQFAKCALLPSDINILIICLDNRIFLGNVVIDVGSSRELSESRIDLIPIDRS